MKYDYKTGLIAGMLAVSSIVSISALKGEINQIPAKEEDCLVERDTTYDYNYVSNLVLVHVYNNYLNETELFIASKEFTKFGKGRGFNYINIFSNDVLSDEEFTFIEEEPLFNYILFFNEQKQFYTIDDLGDLYDKIIDENNIQNKFRGLRLQIKF